MDGLFSLTVLQRWRFNPMTKGGRRGGFNQPACGALCSRLNQCSTLAVAPPYCFDNCVFKSIVLHVAELRCTCTGCFRMERHHHDIPHLLTSGKSYLQPVSSHLMEAATLHKRGSGEKQRSNGDEPDLRCYGSGLCRVQQTPASSLC